MFYNQKKTQILQFIIIILIFWEWQIQKVLFYQMKKKKKQQKIQKEQQKEIVFIFQQQLLCEQLKSLFFCWKTEQQKRKVKGRCGKVS